MSGIGGTRSGNLRVAIVTPGLYPFVVGGIQRHSRMLAEHLSRLGVHVTVYHTAYQPEQAAAARRLDGCDPDVWRDIEAHFVPYPTPYRFPGHFVFDEARYSRAVLHRFQEIRPVSDFIYAEGFVGLAFVRARRSGQPLPPVGVIQHGYEMFQPTTSLHGLAAAIVMRSAAREIDRKADVVFAFSGRIRRIVDRLGRGSSRHVVELPNAVGESWLVDDATPPHPGPRRFVFVGRRERRKGYPELTEAIRRIAPSHARFTFVGDVPAAEQLKLPHVSYAGVITDTATIQGLLDAHDVLVCPSYAEGMPTVILEAMARGLAVLATDVGAVAELVDDEVGILIPRPQPATLLTALRRFIAMPDSQLATMKQAALARARRYTWPIVGAQTLAAIRTYLDSHQDERLQ